MRAKSRNGAETLSGAKTPSCAKTSSCAKTPSRAKILSGAKSPSCAKTSGHLGQKAHMTFKSRYSHSTLVIRIEPTLRRMIILPQISSFPNIIYINHCFSYLK
jgi:hypothetical protein